MEHFQLHCSNSVIAPVAAAEKVDSAAAKLRFPSYRDEMVTVLLGTIDHHPWGRRASELTASTPSLSKGADDKCVLNTGSKPYDHAVQILRSLYTTL